MTKQITVPPETSLSSNAAATAPSNCAGHLVERGAAEGDAPAHQDAEGDGRVHMAARRVAGHCHRNKAARRPRVLVQPSLQNKKRDVTRMLVACSKHA
jgi:hypothetical protein